MRQMIFATTSSSDKKAAGGLEAWEAEKTFQKSNNEPLCLKVETKNWKQEAGKSC
jgi:hypothetical protein